MQRILAWTTLAAMLALPACVTINVYFPEAAAEKAAEQFVDKVIGSEGAVAPAEPAPVQPGHAPGAMLLDLVIPSAHAQAVDINVRTVDAPDPDNPDARYVRITTDIRHAAGEGAIAQGSADYAALKQWIERGYSKDGVPRDFPSQNRGECTGGVARVPGMDLAAAPADMSCSHSGIFTCGAARLTTAMTSGARARRWRSNSIWSGVASGWSD